MFKNVSYLKFIIRALITKDLAKKTNAKNILRSLESTRRDNELRPPATAAFRRSFFVNLRIVHSIPLYREFKRLINSENFKVSI